MTASTPAARVTEFLRQYTRPRTGHDPEEIYGINTDPDAAMANLTVSDLASLLLERKQRTAPALTTTAEVEALPQFTVIQAADGLVLQRFADPTEQDEEPWECMGSNLTYRSDEISLPVQVLK